MSVPTVGADIIRPAVLCRFTHSPGRGGKTPVPPHGRGKPLPYGDWGTFARRVTPVPDRSLRAADSRPYGIRRHPRIPVHLYRIAGLRADEGIGPYDAWTYRRHRRGGRPRPPGGTMSVLRIRPGAFASLSEGGGIRPLPPSAACGGKREGDRFSGGRSTRKPDDGRSTPSVIAASGADSSLGEGAVESLSPRGRLIAAPTEYGDIRASRYICTGSRLCGPMRASAPTMHGLTDDTVGAGLAPPGGTM